MQVRTLGKSELKLTPIGLGCWQFSQGKGMIGKVWSTLDQVTMDDIVAAALAGGINWFDTAEVYGDGNSERALAAALTRKGLKPGDVKIATKWFPFLRTASSLIKTFPQRQACLDPFPIDLHQIHMPFSLSSAEKQAMALVKLLKAGLVRAVGVSNFSAAMMRRVQSVLVSEGFVLASNQVHYNLLRRDIERDDTLAAAQELGVSIIAYSPLAKGLLTGRFHDDPGLVNRVSRMRRFTSGINADGLRRSEPLVRYLQERALKHGTSTKPVTAAQVALNWLVNFHGEQVFAIPGASRATQAQEAAHALDFSLNTDELDTIDRLSRAASAKDS